jgi:hypothetical protein
MAGGSPAKTPPSQITTAWRTLIPGFDETKYEISDFKATVNGNKAQLANYGHASHYITINGRKEEWIVAGN